MAASNAATTSGASAEDEEAEHTDKTPTDEALATQTAHEELPELQRPEAEEDGAELLVHSLGDDNQIIPHQPTTQASAEDEDTQPISWQDVRENLDAD